MISYYAVVRYMPDPRIEEFINIGVVILPAEGPARCRFLHTWRRVRVFGGEDITFLMQFAVEFTAQLPTLDLATLRSMATNFQNSIQLTPPSASLQGADEDWLQELATLYLTNR